MAFLQRLVAPVLVALHGGLLAWAVVGLAEWLATSVPWAPVSNPLFPRWVLLLHWLAVLGAAGVFLGGYFSRWPGTPYAMIPAYAFMAAVCFIETFWFLEHPYRYHAFVVEIILYIAIPLALFRLPPLAARFRTAPAAP